MPKCAEYPLEHPRASRFVSQDFMLFYDYLSSTGLLRVRFCTVVPSCLFRVLNVLNFSTVILLFSVSDCVGLYSIFRLLFGCLACTICTLFDVFSVYHYVAFFIFLQTYDGKRCVPGTRPLVSLLFHCKTHHRARLLPRPACVSSIVYRVECAEEFFRLVRACSNSSVVCSGVNFLSYSIAKAVAIASAISSLVAVYRFI